EDFGLPGGLRELAEQLAQGARAAAGQRPVGGEAQGQALRVGPGRTRGRREAVLELLDSQASVRSHEAPDGCGMSSLAEAGPLRATGRRGGQCYEHGAGARTATTSARNPLLFSPPIRSSVHTGRRFNNAST